MTTPISKRKKSHDKLDDLEIKNPKLSKEFLLIFYVFGVYVLLIQWGYLQEKITSTPYYHHITNESLHWNYPLLLNCIMALSAAIIAWITQQIFEAQTFSSSNKYTLVYWKAALANTIASPIGYASLQYISFPLMILTKSSKPVPVMLIGVIFYGRKYTWYKYLSVFLICLGIAMFSSSKFSSASSSSTNQEGYKLATGIILVLCNLFLDGYTNNEQDAIFKKYQVSSYQLMKVVNMWQVIYLTTILACLYFVYGESSEGNLGLNMLLYCNSLQYDIFLFCICAGFGQILIFIIMKEFGSLAWVTLSVTRKLFTILISVVMFNHTVKLIQWIGVASVFIGMSLDGYMGYKSSQSKFDKTK